MNENKEFLRKLVDLYAGDELPQEMVEDLEAEAMQDPDLSHDMFTLKRTLQMLRSSAQPAYTEESFQRILLRMRTLGAEVETRSPEPRHWQYTLPMQG